MLGFGCAGCTEYEGAFHPLSYNMEKLLPIDVITALVFFKGRSLSMQQQMMQQSRQLDPNLLMKQQTPPSQQQSLHQPSIKPFLENVIPHATPELQKGPSPINAFSSFPIGESPAVSQCLCDTQLFPLPPPGK